MLLAKIYRTNAYVGDFYGAETRVKDFFEFPYLLARMKGTFWTKADKKMDDVNRLTASHFLAYFSSFSPCLFSLIFRSIVLSLLGMICHASVVTFTTMPVKLGAFSRNACPLISANLCQVDRAEDEITPYNYVPVHLQANTERIGSVRFVWLFN